MELPPIAREPLLVVLHQPGLRAKHVSVVANSSLAVISRCSSS
jgi:hypothetical protein